MKKVLPVVLMVLCVLNAFVAVGCNGGSSTPPAVTIALKSSTATTIGMGQMTTITATLTNDSLNQGVTWALTGPGTLSNKTATSVTYEAPATASSTVTATISATSVANTASNSQIVITINPPPRVTTTSIPAAAVGKAYSVTLQAFSGTGDYTWTVSTGSLPSWAKLDASTGVISGTPDTSGKSDFSITVTDAAGLASAAQALSLVVEEPVVVSTTSLPDGMVGTAYSVALQATGGSGTYTWSISNGSLPSWAKLDASTGVISGTPDASGTTNFSATATDDDGLASAAQALSLVIKPAAALVISTTSLPDGVVTVPYASKVEATGGFPPYTWSVSSGSLPSWAKLDTATGDISGTPDAEGSKDFTVKVSDSQATPATATQALTITIKPESSVNDPELHGQYAFLLQGFDDTSGAQFAIVGSFLADGNGNITNGLEDMGGPGGYQPEVAFKGKYNVGSDNRGYATITNSLGKSITFAFALGGMDKNNVATSGSLIEFDDTTGTDGRRGTGSLYMQDTNAFGLVSMSGPYAFQVVGDDGPGTRGVATGAFMADGKGNVTNGDEEINISGNTSEVSFTGTFSTDTNTNTFGRMTLQVVAEGDTSHNVVYIVGSGHALTMTAEETSGLLSGEVRAQASSSFSTASLNGTAVISATGLSNDPSYSDTFAGLIKFDGAGNASMSVDINSHGQVSADSFNFAYSVADNGRAVFTDSNVPQAVAYLLDQNEGFSMNLDNSAATEFVEAQTGAPFSNASLSGSYVLGTVPAAVTGSGVASGIGSSAGDGKLTVTYDNSHPADLLEPDQSGTLDVTVDSNGRGTDAQGAFVYYLVSPGKVVLINLNSQYPTIGILKSKFNPPPKVLTSSLRPAAVGTPYSATLQASDGTGAYTWGISTGTLPTWGHLDPATGIISGTPNATSTANFSVTVTDAAGLSSAPQSLTLQTTVPPPLAVSTTTLPEGEVGVPYSAQLEAGGGLPPYTWTVSSGLLPSWAYLNSSTGVISGTPNATGATTFSVVAADAAGTISTAQALTLVVNPPTGLTILTTVLPSGVIFTPYATYIQVGGGLPPYTWSFAGGSPPSWAQLDSYSGKISGLPTASGTSTFTVKVTDSEATPAVATATISLTISDLDSTNDAELKGQYAFRLQGFDDATGQQFAVIGSFIADGNSFITGGIEDSNGPEGYRPAVPITGRYNVGADNRGHGSFVTEDGKTIRFALAVGGLNSSKVATSASMIEFDDTTGFMGRRGSGSIYLQDSSAFNLASINGPYAFELTGQGPMTGTRTVVAGAFVADGKGNVTNGDEVLQDSGSGTSSHVTYTGTFSATAGTGSFGRVTLQVLVGGQTVDSVAYVVEGDHALVMNTGPASLYGLLAGESRAQSSTSFSAASLSGASAFYNVGLGSVPGTSDVQLGLIAFNGAGVGSVDLDDDDGGVLSTKTMDIAYTVAPNGRVTDPKTGEVNGYLIGKNEGFILPSPQRGQLLTFEPQMGGPFSNASISGFYVLGTAAPAVAPSTVVVGVLKSPGDGTVSQTIDISNPNGTLVEGLANQFSVTVDPHGRGTDGSGTRILYVVSPTKVFSVHTVGGNPTVTVIDQLKP